MTPSPRDSQASSWSAFRLWFAEWRGSDDASRLAGIGNALERLRPHLDRAFLRTRRGLAVLPKESVCRDRILARFLGLDLLPEAEEAFQLWMQSQILRAVVEDRDAGISRLDGLNPAWDGLRNTINRLPRTDRRTLLHALMPFCVDFPEEEANQGLRRAKDLWTTVSKRVPAEAIPDSWDVERLEDTVRPQRAADFLATGVFGGDNESAQRDRFLMGSLAKTLYRLGLQIESQAESSTPLILDPEILRTREERHVDFLQKWRDEARSMLLDLGVPDDVLAFLVALSEEQIGLNEFSSVDLLTMAGRLGHSKADVYYSLGAHAMRSGQVEKADHFFELGKAVSATDMELATGLANQAGVAFESGGPALAFKVLEEARG
ncbi:MAG: hypothetical protein ACYSU1_02545, partial [Planctomycetota bacterium]